MARVRFLTLEEVLILHEDQIDRYGGSSGIRDIALLESAVVRPQATFSGADLYVTIFDKAAALFHSLALNHPFIDGNKRTATVAALVFLEINGFAFKISPKDLVQLTLKVATKKISVEDLSIKLKKSCHKL